MVQVARRLRAGSAVLFGCLSLGLVAGFGYAAVQPREYTATAVGYVVVDAGSAGGSINQLSRAEALAQRRLHVYADLATGANVTRDVVAQLHPPGGVRAVADAVVVTTGATTPLLRVRATAATSGDARSLAGAVVTATAREALRLETAARPVGAATSSSVRLVPTGPALTPSTASSPDYSRCLGLGALAGLVLGLVLLLARLLRTRGVRPDQDLERILGGAVLTELPTSPELDRDADNGLLASQTGPTADALRRLRGNLRYVDVDNPPRSLVVTAPDAGVGSSTVAANLARALAATGQPTVLVEGDLRHPIVAETFELEPAVGLTQLLTREAHLADVIQDPGVPSLGVVVAGRLPPGPTALLGSERMRSVEAELVDLGYVVIIDAPPLLSGVDASILGAVADGTLLVLATRHTRTARARRAARALTKSGGRLLGVVLNRATAAPAPVRRGLRSNGDTALARRADKRMRRREHAAPTPIRAGAGKRRASSPVAQFATDHLSWRPGSRRVS